MLTKIMFCTVLHIVRLKERSGYKSHFSIPRLRSYKRTGLYMSMSENIEPHIGYVREDEEE
jgi:hypothetical protein